MALNPLRTYVRVPLNEGDDRGVWSPVHRTGRIGEHMHITLNRVRAGWTGQNATDWCDVVQCPFAGDVAPVCQLNRAVGAEIRPEQCVFWVLA